MPGEHLTNLPAPRTRLIGREGDLAAVFELALHAEGRLVTLSGAGGSGKTSLALEVARALLPAFPDGVWLAELASLSDPVLVPGAVAAALGVRDRPGRPLAEVLAEYLQPRTLLLVLDNCEHLMDPCAQFVEGLLSACPDLRVLATSREPLRIPGEVVWRVPSLAVPDLRGRYTADELAGYAAVRLFVERARAVQPAFRLTSSNAAAVAEVCVRLDGIPLAMELAAARVRAFSVEQIAAYLDDRFHLLTAGPRTALPRQQTLQATVDWSYALLSEPERTLLRRLSVFAGGWSFEAAEAVAAGEGIHAYAMLDLLAQLVDKSLVIADEQRGVVRYRLLETIRQYAHQRLLEAGEAERTRDRHLAYFLRLAEAAELKLRGPEARAVMDRLEEEHDNLRAALEWALAPLGRGDAALRLSGALAWFWWVRDYHSEGRRWLARVLAASPDRTAPRMKALHGAGFLAHHQRDADAARALLVESLAIARELDDRWTVAWTLHCLGRVAYFDNDPQTARSLGEQSLAVAQAISDPSLIAWAHHLLGLAAYIAADDVTARAHYEQSLAIRRKLGFDEGIGILLSLLGLVAIREGDLGQAHALSREALIMVQGLLGPWGLCMPLAALSRIAAAWGQPLRAVRLGAAATALSELYQTPLIPLFEPPLAEGLELARRVLGEAVYLQTWTEGTAMSLDQAVAEALAIEVAPPATQPAAGPESRGGDPFGDLTPAEVQVLRLLAGGRTTKEIAAELVVAVSTVDRHITHIYGKLGARNRAEATAFALKHGLAETE